MKTMKMSVRSTTWHQWTAKKKLTNQICGIKANRNFPMMQGLKMLGDWKKSRRVPGERLDWITKVFNIFSESSEMSFLDNATVYYLMRKTTLN